MLKQTRHYVQVTREREIEQSKTSKRHATATRTRKTNTEKTRAVSSLAGKKAPSHRQDRHQWQIHPEFPPSSRLVLRFLSPPRALRTCGVAVDVFVALHACFSPLSGRILQAHVVVVVGRFARTHASNRIARTGPPKARALCTQEKRSFIAAIDGTRPLLLSPQSPKGGKNSRRVEIVGREVQPSIGRMSRERYVWVVVLLPDRKGFLRDGYHVQSPFVIRRNVSRLYCSCFAEMGKKEAGA